MKLLVGYNWPGNVRELENVIERAVILTNKNIILPKDLPPAVINQQKSAESADDGSEPTLEALEKNYILKILDKYTWNQKKASEVLGISTTTLWRKLKSYGIEPKRM